MIHFSISFNRSEKRFEYFAICTIATDSKRKMCETAHQVFTRRNNFLNGLCGLLEREKRYLSGKVEIQFFQAEPRSFSYSYTKLHLIFCKLIKRRKESILISLVIDNFSYSQLFCFNSCVNFLVGKYVLLSSRTKNIKIAAILK